MRGATCRVLIASWLLVAHGASAEERRETPASDGPPATQAACVPACRAGYVCVDGRCVMACNPPCAAEERCTAQGECEPRAMATSREFSTDASDAPMPEPTVDDASSERPTRRNSTGMMVTGIVLAGAAGVVALSGLPLLLIGDTRECHTSVVNGTQHCSGTNFTPLGAGLVITGGVLAAIGIPLVVIGAKRVPAGSRGAGVTVWLATGPSEFAMRGTW